MSSNKTAHLIICRGEAYLTSRGAVEAVQIASDLIAFYPQPIHEPQPYVILLSPASGILKRLALRSAECRHREGTVGKRKRESEALHREPREFASGLLVEDVLA
jgi:hypothetical protein